MGYVVMLGQTFLWQGFDVLCGLLHDSASLKVVCIHALQITFRIFVVGPLVVAIVLLLVKRRLQVAGCAEWAVILAIGLVFATFSGIADRLSTDLLFWAEESIVGLCMLIGATCALIPFVIVLYSAWPSA